MTINQLPDQQQIYDVLVVGAGPAGMMASIYASRYKLPNLVIGLQVGGTITLAHLVENFPGFTKISGLELANRMAEQVNYLGAEVVVDGVSALKKEGEIFTVGTERGNTFSAKTLILTTGTERRKLNVPGEKELLGRGVSYCTNCDAPFFKEKTVILVGGSDAAVSGAIHVSSFASKVYIIYRGDKLRAEPIWTQQALNNPKIEIIYNTNVTEIVSDGAKVTGVKLDRPYKGQSDLKTDGVFIEIGGIPGSSLAGQLGVKVNGEGFVEVSERMETNIKGVFAAGDFTTQGLIMPQAIVACAHGAIAAYSAFKFLKEEENKISK